MTTEELFKIDHPISLSNGERIALLEMVRTEINERQDELSSLDTNRLFNRIEKTLETDWLQRRLIVLRAIEAKIKQ
jgi:hypothetical protein